MRQRHSVVCQYSTPKQEKYTAKLTRLVETAFIAFTGIIMGMHNGLVASPLLEVTTYVQASGQSG